MAEILDPIYESPLSRCGAVGKLPTFRVESLRVGHVVLACSFPISCNAAVAFCRLRTNIHWQKKSRLRNFSIYQIKAFIYFHKG